ncbi:MAG: aldehyde dehydrogenase family protein [Bdellovibrionota bacterium]|nr:aldehyde dehydrogenase family protein [Bdellovibrionota bacterium]
MEDEILQIIEKQKKFFDSKQTYPYEARLKKLKNLKEAVVRNETLIGEALNEDLKKSPYQSYLAETGYIIHEITKGIKRLKKWMRPVRISTPIMLFPSVSSIVSEPVGQVLIIGPWNYPFHLIFIPLVGAIAAGNTVIVKPSEVSSRSAEVIKKIIEETFKIEEIAVINGGVEVTQFILEQKFNHIFFTGSTSVGRIVAEKAAKFLTPVTLELGGKCPCVIFGENDIDLTAKRIVWGKYLNTGQTCVAPDYILVEKNIKKKLIDRIIHYIEEFYGKDPAVSEFYGKIINKRNFQRIMNLFSEEEILYGGKSNEDALYISPTIVEANTSSKVMSEEIFGPILPILEVESFEDCISIINSLPKPLAVYLFSKNSHLRQRIQSDTQSGSICFNDNAIQLASSDLPFGGFGESGVNRYHGRTSFDTFSNKKSIVRRFQLLDWVNAPFRYAPDFKNLSIVRWVWRLFG